MKIYLFSCASFYSSSSFSYHHSFQPYLLFQGRLRFQASTHHTCSTNPRLPCSLVHLQSQLKIPISCLHPQRACPSLREGDRKESMNYLSILLNIHLRCMSHFQSPSCHFQMASPPLNRSCILDNLIRRIQLRMHQKQYLQHYLSHKTEFHYPPIWERILHSLNCYRPILLEMKL